MQCEICGAEVPGAPTRIVVDGSLLEVCRSCARFGKPEDKRSPVTRKMVPVERAFNVSRPKPRPRNYFKDLVEIDPEYGRVIREAREEMGLSREKLGVKIKEKASLIGKIERQDIVPEDSIRKKLERELKVKLTDEEVVTKWKPGSGSRGLTLGDIANIKKR